MPVRSAIETMLNINHIERKDVSNQLVSCHAATSSISYDNVMSFNRVNHMVFHSFIHTDTIYVIITGYRRPVCMTLDIWLIC